MLEHSVTDAATVFQAFEKTANRCPDSDFLHQPASATRKYAGGALTYTYAQALENTRALAAAFERAGLGPGHRVATLLENRPEALFVWFALNGLGASVVPINPDYRASEIAYLLEHSDVDLVVVLPERQKEVADVASNSLNGVQVLTPADAAQGRLRSYELRRDAIPGRDTECAVLYTSGTTGRPKGCLLSNDYFIRSGLRYLNRGGSISLQRDRERLLTPLPMFHMNAMASTTMSMVLTGGCLVLLDRFHPSTWWEDVVSSRATGVHYLGVMPAILLGQPIIETERQHRVRYGFGANVEPRHHAAFESRFGFPLIEAWAMTETGSGASLSAEYEPRHVGTRCFGRVPPDVELRLVDEQMRDVPPGQAGEMVVRCLGPNPRLGFFRGYLKDEAATEAGWAGGWWHTGDLAMQGPDGSLHYVDRKKNMIRRSGENIAALEVEQILRENEAVAEIAVTAVPDPVRGDEVLACIVLAEGRVPHAQAARTLVAWMLKRAAYFKAPGWVVFVEKLPTTATQKLDRAGLKAYGQNLVDSGACLDMRGMKRRQN